MLELIKPVTLETDAKYDNKSNEDNNTKAAGNKLNNNTEETMENIDTSETLLKLSKSAANPKHVKKVVALAQVCVEKK